MWHKQLTELEELREGISQLYQEFYVVLSFPPVSPHVIVAGARIWAAVKNIEAAMKLLKDDEPPYCERCDQHHRIQDEFHDDGTCIILPEEET